MDLTIIANVLVLLANLGVLGLSLKLYTEGMKDRNMSARTQKDRANSVLNEPG